MSQAARLFTNGRSQVARLPAACRFDVKGQTLAPLDTQIAAHALRVGAVLVSSDRAFKQAPGLLLEDCSK